MSKITLVGASDIATGQARGASDANVRRIKAGVSLVAIWLGASPRGAACLQSLSVLAGLSMATVRRRKIRSDRRRAAARGANNFSSSRSASRSNGAGALHRSAGRR